jgi:PAS domain S-box-containing protein
MNKYLELLLRKPKKNDVLTQMRRRILKTMLTGSFWIGTVLFLIALIPVIQRGLYVTILIYSILYLWIILITFLPHLPYRVRAIGWLGLFYVLGTINLFMSGFNVDAGLFFITFIVMAILLMDLPGGGVALAFSFMAISVSGIMNVRQSVHLSLALPQSNPLLWIIGGMVFLLTGGLVNYSLTKVVYGLDDNLAKANYLSEELEQKNRSLQLSEARYRTLVETSPGLVVLLDLKGNVLMANQVGLALFGYENQEEVFGKNMLVFIAPEDKSRVAESFQKTIQSGPPNDLECLALKKDGGKFYAEFNAALVRDEAGEPQAVIGIGRDISDRKEEERILREAKEMLARKVVETSVQLEQTSNQLEELVKHGPAVIFSYQASDHAFTYMSENVATLLGYEADRFMDDKNFWRSRVHPEDARSVINQMDLDHSQERSKYDYRILKKDGAYCWLHCERILLSDNQGNPIEYVGSWIDITERKRNEESLRFFQDSYRSLYESMMDAYVSVDMDGRIQQFNWAYLKMLGYASEELKKLTYQDLTPEKWHDMEDEIVLKQVIPRGYSDIYEKEYLRKDGTILPVELRTVLLRDGAGNPSGMWAIIRDVSERKIIEQALRNSEERYRTLAEAAHDAIFILSQDGILQYINTFGAKLVGKEPLEIVGQSWKNIFSPEAAQRRENNVLRAFQTGETITSESWFDSPKGLLWLSALLVPMKDATGRVIAVLGISRDITERKKSEEALQQVRDQLEERVKVRTSELYESQDQLRQLTAQTIHVQEAERRSISRDLHDEAGQALVTLKYGLAALQNDLPERDKLSRKRLSDSIQIIDQTMLHIRTLAHNLRPPVMEIGGIHMSLQEYCHEMSDRAQIPISYQGVDIPGLPYDICISLFRFVQEGLTNIMKHSQATKVKVKLQYRRGEINLSVSDNGHGIEETSQSDGLGLLGIRERLTLIGGTLEIQSKKGKGVQLIGCVPWVNSGKI